MPTDFDGKLPQFRGDRRPRMPAYLSAMQLAAQLRGWRVQCDGCGHAFTKAIPLLTQKQYPPIHNADPDLLWVVDCPKCGMPYYCGPPTRLRLE